MKVLVTTTPFLSHLWDLVPTAWALRSAGHDVRVAALPDLTDGLVRTGLTAVPIGLPLADDDWLPAGQGQQPLAVFARAAGRLAARLAHGLFESVEQFRPDLVVSEPMELAGPMLAQQLGVPAVHQSWGPPFAAKATRALRQAGARLRRRFALPEQVADPDLVLDVCPPSYQDEATRSNRLAAPYQSMRYVPYNGPGEVPSWLHERSSRPRVCITVGTGHEGLPLLPRIANAISELAVEVVVPVRPEYAAHVAAAAPEAHVVDWLPLKLLFAAGCDVAVHHGGPGSTLTGLGYGVPQLAVVVGSHVASADHTINARLLTGCGAGLALRDNTMTDADIRTAVSELLRDTAYRGAARALAAEIAAQPSPAEVVPVLERVVGTSAVGRRHAQVLLGPGRAQ